MMRLLTLADILLLHEKLIRETGGNPGIHGLNRECRESPIGYV